MSNLILLAFLVCFSSMAFSQNLISGSIINKNSGETLPFATIALKKSGIGTSANSKGEFELLIPENVVDDSLVVSYLGFQNFSAHLTSIAKQPLVIKLTPKSLSLTELIVKPMPPTYYIKKAMEQVAVNYQSQPFQTQAYYFEEVLENGAFIKDAEAIFLTHFPNYLDTTRNQHQLVLYREGDVNQVQFLKSKTDKKAAKDKKKAEKDGKEYEEKEYLQIVTGGPEGVLSMDFIKDKPAFLDSTKFNKYKYGFGGSSSFQDKNLMIINFLSKKLVDHQYQEGKIYIDTDSYAIVAINFRGDFVIPFYIRTLLFAVGLEISNPIHEFSLTYYENDGKWFPKEFKQKIDFNIEKRNLFKKNEFSSWKMNQLLHVNKISQTDLIPIAADKKYSYREKPQKQVYNNLGLRWEDVNVIKRAKM